MTTRLRKWFLASPPAEWALNWLRELLIGALKQGPVPKHVAFVMDGNRRYARTHRIETVEGHHLGFEALARVLEICYKAGVSHVTIYAFSIENFKRSRYEVDALMDMAKVKLTQLSQHGDLMNRYGVCIRVLGDRALVKPDVLKAIDKTVEMTSRNGSSVLNICFPYTSRDEMTTAIRETVQDWNQPLGRGDSGKQFHSQHLASRSQDHAHDLGRCVQSFNNASNTTIISPSSSTTSLSSAADSHPTSSSSFSSTTTLHQPSPSSGPGDGKHLSSPYQTSFQPPPPTSSSPTPSTSNPISTTPTTSKSSPTLASAPTFSTSSSSLPSEYPCPESITSSTLTSHMVTADNPPLDLLIRTSAVHRLSDFMLWQCHQHTEIVFLDVLWPQFDLWSFLPVLWGWQRKQRNHTNDLEERNRGQVSRLKKEA